jgi:hypothetical protein
MNMPVAFSLLLFFSHFHVWWVGRGVVNDLFLAWSSISKQLH